MAEYEKLVRRKLSEEGCYFVRRGKGDHDTEQVNIAGIIGMLQECQEIKSLDCWDG